MHVVLGIITESPYRQSIERFSDQFADLLDGRVKLVALGQRTRTDTNEEAPEPAEEEEALLERAQATAAEEFRRIDRGPETQVEVEWLGGPPVEEACRALVRCDFGVVGKAFRGEPTGGAGIGPEVGELKQKTPKPLIIVPKEIQPIKQVLFVYTDHPESGHALYLAKPLAEKGCSILLTTAISPYGATELRTGGAGYLKEHGVEFEEVEVECTECAPGAGPMEELMQVAREQEVDLIVMGGTRRGLIGRMLWPELAREVVWNAHVPVLIWY